jgi:nitrogen regulatory protein PII
MNTLDVSKVRDIVKEKGTSSVTVTILKTNGTQRVINGVFKPTSDIKLDESLAKDGRIAIYCMTDNAWRSFKEHRVLDII